MTHRSESGFTENKNEGSYGLPDAEALRMAHELVSKWVHQTPVMQSQSLNRILGARLWFKCENFQKAGAFKFRGATHALLRLSPKERAKGVATHSSGNHAQALALAARMHDCRAFIVMPENAPSIKVAAVREYGGHIVFCRPTLDDREKTLAQVISQTGAHEIHPYNDYRIIAGQASAAAELFQQAGIPDFLIAPVGGGGLLSGSILSARHFAPSCRVFGAEPLKAADAAASFQSGVLQPSVNPDTIADGLRTSLGSLTWPIIKQGAEDIITAREDSIVKAMQLIWERMKIVIEPSAALPLAVVLEHPARFQGKSLGLILSGGNRDFVHDYQIKQ